MDAPPGKARRLYAHPEYWLVALAIFAASTIWVFTYLSVEQDRKITRASSFEVSQSIALSLDAHVTESVRAASNALTAAALLIERAGGPRKFSTEALQRELERELPDKTSVMRLVVLDRDAHTVATSDARQVPPIHVPQREFYQWHLARPADTSVRVSHALRTEVQQQWVIPVSRAIVVDGRFEGVIVAQLDVRYFEAFYRRLAALYPATLGVTHQDGRIMFRYPFDEAFMDRDPTSEHEWAQMRAGPGTTESTSELDGRRRFVSHRPLAGSPLVVLVGIDEEKVMAPWRERTFQRVSTVAAGSVVFFALLWAVVAFLRRLSRSEARFRHLYGGANDGIVLVRGERIIDVNPACLAILGYTRAEEMIGRSPGDFRSGSGNEAVLFRARLERVLGGENIRYEVTLRRRDGSEVVVESSLSTVDDRGETLVMSMFRDITERKRAEAELQGLAAELESRVERRTAQLSATLRELESFSYTVSHDLRAPVRQTRGYIANILQDFGPVLPRECAHMIKRIDAASERMDALIKGLLALSKVSRDAMSLVRCDLGAIAYSVVASLRELEPERDVQVHIETALEAPADRGMIEALLGNLIGNAWKFTAKTVAPRIVIGRTTLLGKPVFFVRDNGAGFDMANASKLFEPFRRLHSASEFPGTGIGLATVHRIIERHGGGIEVESAPDGGCCFYFSLDAVDTVEERIVATA